MEELLGERTTVRDLVVKYPRTRPVLERFGIDYCCGGGHTLKDAAAEKGVVLDALFAALKDSIETPVADSSERERDWSFAPLTELADHIEERHHTFMKEQLPRLHELMAKVLKAHGPRHGEMLSQLQDVYQSLRREIEQHLMKEEQILFPGIRQIDACAHEGGKKPELHCGSVQNPIRQMEHEHDNAGAALAKMRELTSDYTLLDDACNTFAALYDGLRDLEDDLHEHIHLENNILFPKSIELEEKSGIA
jgi:regulator of cell morphogenesis and NO signaling